MSRHTLPDPPDELKQISAALSAVMREEIRDHGPMPFSRYMDMALYQPGLGYYSAGLHNFGEAGDFVTSPELGSLFAGCLVQQIEQLAAHLGDYDIFEVGAGSGRLAADILQQLDPDLLPRRYMILDRSADLKQVQRERLAGLAPALQERVEWLDQPPDQSWRGLLLANEVIDAMAIERFQLTAGGVEQLCVSAAADGFQWAVRPAPAELANAVSALGLELPDGYRSELNLQLGPWLEAMTAGMQQGLALFIDYGYPRREYYMPERTDGTLICHYRHRAHDDVFFWPGLQDMTAWVDFTALAEASQQCQMSLEGYTSQAMFLLGCGLDQVLTAQKTGSSDGGMALNAEARHLMLPGMMGERFQVMGLGRNLEIPLKGFSQLDLCHRL